MANIEVQEISADLFEVTVSEGSASTTHWVEATPPAVERYAPGSGAAELVRASFRFLLDREPKESILGRFDLPTIERYFPSYPAEIGGYLGEQP